MLRGRTQCRAARTTAPYPGYRRDADGELSLGRLASPRPSSAGTPRPRSPSPGPSCTSRADLARAFGPGLLPVGPGIGVMLTSSVTVVQSSFPEADQGEISGLSRSVSNQGSSPGVAIAGTVIVSSPVTGNLGYALALIVLAVFAGIGPVAAILLPASPVPEAPEPAPPDRRSAG